VSRSIVYAAVRELAAYVVVVHDLQNPGSTVVCKKGTESENATTLASVGSLFRNLWPEGSRNVPKIFRAVIASAKGVIVPFVNVHESA
jgi:hypothetical protein